MTQANPYDRYLGLPGDILTSRTVATLAPMTALQNLVVGESGDIVMTSLLDGRLWLVPYGGECTLLTQIDGRPSGIAAAPDGGWLVFGWTTKGGVAVFRVQPDGTWDVFVDVPDAVFPNGAVRLSNDDYLFADSIKGKIWHVNYATRTVSGWLEHPTLAPRPGAWAPALNGLQMWQDRLYMSNSATSQLLSIQVRDGEPVGEPALVRDDVDLDDFAFDVDGTLYSGTHPFDVILKLTQDGKLSRSAGPDEGVRGCPACAFGRASGDESGLYVISDGGLFNPLSGGLKAAGLVRLETGVAGAKPISG